MPLLYFKNMIFPVLHLFVFIIVKSHDSCKRFFLFRGNNQRWNIQTNFTCRNTFIYAQKQIRINDCRHGSYIGVFASVNVM